MPTAPQFPSREALTGFLRMDRRRRVRVSLLAELLGAPVEQVQDLLRTEGVYLRFDSLAWGEAASYLFDAWSRTQIIDAASPDAARLIPSDFRPAPVPWRIPPFILRAMEYQAARMRASDPRVNGAGARFISPAVEDYVADVLFAEIAPSTVDDLAADAAFFDAYHFPPLD